MPNSNSPLSQDALLLLERECQQAIEEYDRTRNPKTDSSSSVEILRHAARGEKEPIGVILALSRSLIERKCPPDLRAHVEDITQNVTLRLIKKFYNQKSPFHVTTFPKYRVYVKTTTANVIIDFRNRSPDEKSLDKLREEEKFEPQQEDDTKRVETLMLFNRCLDLLTDPLEREVIRRRYGLGQKPLEIVQALRSTWPELDTKKVYRFAENAIRRLKKMPEFQK